MRHCSILLQEFAVAHGDVAEQDVAVPGHGLGVGGDGEVGTERERALAERGCGGVVDGDQSAGAVGALAERGDVADLHGGVAGRLDPEQARAFELLALRVVGGGREADDDAHLGEVVLHEDAGGEVGVGGQHGDVAGTQDGAEDRRRRQPCRRRRPARWRDRACRPRRGQGQTGRTPSGRWRARARSRWGCASARSCRARRGIAGRVVGRGEDRDWDAGARQRRRE